MAVGQERDQELPDDLFLTDDDLPDLALNRLPRLAQLLHRLDIPGTRLNLSHYNSFGMRDFVSGSLG
jgi:hypothetical protein